MTTETLTAPTTFEEFKHAIADYIMGQARGRASDVLAEVGEQIAVENVRKNVDEIAEHVDLESLWDMGLFRGPLAVDPEKCIQAAAGALSETLAEGIDNGDYEVPVSESCQARWVMSSLSRRRAKASSATATNAVRP